MCTLFIYGQLLYIPSRKKIISMFHTEDIISWNVWSTSKCNNKIIRCCTVGYLVGNTMNLDQTFTCGSIIYVRTMWTWSLLAHIHTRLAVVKFMWDQDWSDILSEVTLSCEITPAINVKNSACFVIIIHTLYTLGKYKVDV